MLSPNDTQAIFAVKFDGAGTVAHPKARHADFALTGGKAGAFIGAGTPPSICSAITHALARLPAIGARSMPTSPRHLPTTTA